MIGPGLERRSLARPLPYEAGVRPEPHPFDGEPATAPIDGAELAALHALAWLTAGSGVGLLLAVLLVAPGLGVALGPFTYGRFMPLHMDLLLYGWIALPLVALLLRAYRPPPRWAARAVQAWSGALVTGAAAWLAGQTTAKPFLDWQGIGGALFLASLLFLAGVLGVGLRRAFHPGRAALWLGLLLVPGVLVFAASPGTYPPVNPASGGPTVASLSWSTVAILAIFALVPWLLGPAGRRALRGAEARRWLGAFAAWGLLLAGTSFFLFGPALLARVKFTNALVGHAHLALAGMATSFVALLLAAMNDGTRLAGVLSHRPAFWLWNGGNAVQVAALTAAGALEAADPGVIFRGDSPLLSLLYVARALAGAALLTAAGLWTFRASRALR